MILGRRANRIDRLQRRLSPFFAQRVAASHDSQNRFSRFCPASPFLPTQVSNVIGIASGYQIPTRPSCRAPRQDLRLASLKIWYSFAWTLASSKASSSARRCLQALSVSRSRENSRWDFTAIERKRCVQSAYLTRPQFEFFCGVKRLRIIATRRA